MTKAEETARKHNGHDKLSDRACPDQPHGAGICMDCRILAAALEKFGAEERERQVQRAVEISDLLVDDLVTREKMARALRNAEYNCPTRQREIAARIREGRDATET